MISRQGGAAVHGAGKGEGDQEGGQRGEAQGGHQVPAGGLASWQNERKILTTRMAIK